jgi:uncharacterized phage protein gp47/JayE
MSFVRRNHKQIASNILAQICGGDCAEKLTYNNSKKLYKLANIPVAEVKSVDGTSNGAQRLFAKDLDYVLLADSIQWIAKGSHPDEGTAFNIQYVFTRTSGISDVNVGSVVRNIVEAVSREIEFFYLQMEQAYLSGFLDTASGNALDLVVSLLGIKRKPPQPSSGWVTFGRNSEPEALSTIGEAHLFDGSNEYVLNKSLAKEVTKIQGLHHNSAVVFQKEVDYVLAGSKIRWLPNATKPDTKTVFQVDYSACRQIVIPRGTNIATLSNKPNDVRLFKTVEETSLSMNTEGKWAIEIPVVSVTPGYRGNVLAGAIVTMPTAVQGIEYVINKADITNGVEVETDKDLRERAKHALEFAGKATYLSVESAIRSVEGVKSVLIEDMPDGVPGIVSVVVDGGNIDEIKSVIDNTRAAGIRVEVSRPNIVYVNVSLTLTLDKEAQPATASAEAEQRIRSYISTLGIGDAVLFSRIIESVVGIEHVWDAKATRLEAIRADGFVTETEAENIAISCNERAEPKVISISYEKRK